MVRDHVDEVWRAQLYHKGRNYIGEEHDALRNVRTYKIQGC